MHDSVRQHPKRRDFLRSAGASASVFAVSHLPGFNLLGESEAAQTTARSEPGFRPLFDGVSLKGWTRQIREPLRPGLGIWAVQNGMIVGGQDTPTIGSYLVTDETFSDFELTLEARPDWRADTGVLVRTNAQGNVGLQNCIDYRPHGALVGYYGNNLGGFHACDYCFTGVLNSDGQLERLVPEKPSEPLDATHNVRLDYAIPAAGFLGIWKLHGWNHFRIRSVGAVPRLTTWINGVKVAELDTAKVKSPDWDPDSVERLVGRSGHISLEVHSNRPTDWLGKDRWAPGAVCRWRNISIKTL
jgi:hypothetical protein